MRVFVRLLFCAVLILCIPLRLRAESLGGIVLDPSGVPAAGVNVAIRGNGIDKTAVSDDSGSFRFVELAPGAYKLSALGRGLNSREVTITVGNAPALPVTLALEVNAVSAHVVVTGTRTATELDHSPVSTSLVTKEEIESRNVTQIDQVISTVEGVNAYRTRGPTDSDFQIGLRGFAGRGSPSRTLILLDGQPLNDSYTGAVNWAMLPVSEFERVEVVRGPFSSLYGGNAMGGVINLITRPADQRHIELAGQYGSMDSMMYSARYTDRFFQKLGVSFGYQRYQTGGYQEQPVLKTATTGNGAIPVTGVQTWPTTSGGINYQVGWYGRDWFNQHSYRGRLEYTFSPKTFASLQYFHESRANGFDAYQSNLRNAAGTTVDSGLVSFTDPAGATRVLSLTPVNFIGTPGGARANTYQGQVLHTFSSSWNLRLLAGSAQTPLQWYTTPASNAILTSGNGSYTPQSTRAYYGSVQVGWTPVQRHQIIFGTDTRRDAAGIQVLTVPNYASRDGGYPLTSQATGRSINESVFAQDQYQATERLTLVGGARFDYWKTYDGLNQTSATAAPINYPDRSATATTAKLAASYDAGAGFVLRASVGNAFRSPTIYELYRNLVLGTTLYAANPSAQPERLFSYDTGVQRRFGRWANVDAAFFENRLHDMLYRTTDLIGDPTGRTQRLTNAALARIRGMELAVTEDPFSWLKLKQTYTYNDGVITENPLLPATVGKRLTNVPPHQTSFIAMLVRGRWSGSATGRYQTSVFSTDTNTDVVHGVPGSYSPFFSADLSASYQPNRRLSFTANVTNLMDRRYYLYYLSPGRQVWAGIRFRL